MKTKTKKKYKYKLSFIITSIIATILLIINIYQLYLYINVNKEEKVIEEVLFTQTDEKFNENKKYYANIKYSKFKSLYKSNSISTIAIVDNTSNTCNKFLELVNKTAYYTHTKIYVLELNKLSRKDEIAFYNIDDRLSKLDSNYMITINNNKIISVTTYDNTNLNSLIKGLGE